MPNPTASALDNNIFFTHTTSVIPLGGIMIPGRNLLGATEDSEPPVPPDRFTLHWYPQDLIEAHSGWSNENDSYYIIEPAKCVKAELYGGYAEDFMTLGRHTLSEESVILVPFQRMEEAIQALYPGFKGRLSFYTNRKDAKSQLVEHIASKTQDFKFHLPPNQEQTIQVSLQLLIDSLNSSSVAEQQKYQKVIKEALAKTPRPEAVAIDTYVLPKDLIAEFNGKVVNAKEFFSAWEREGLYFGAHEGSLFQQLEGTSVFLMQLVFSHATTKQVEEEIQKLTTTVKNIKKTLVDRKFPAEIKEYFEQKIEIDLLGYWVPKLKDLLRCPYEVQTDQLIQMSSQTTVLSLKQIQRRPDYETTPLTSQSTAIALSNYSGSFFAAYKRREGMLVDARATLPSEQEAKALQGKLKGAGIHSYFRECEVVVPDINTPMVANAVNRSNPQ